MSNASNKYKPVVVVVAFNRPRSLRRILNSLSLGIYPHDTRLIVSIDNNGTNQEVADFAMEFEWKHGEKIVNYHPERLGLRRHILKCADYALEYGSVIILEDDLFVSPHFYEYTQNALAYYDSCDDIAGISLYNLTYTESSKLPFIPLRDDSDVYFKQVPSSLGQAWTAKHWEPFRKWYETDPDLTEIRGLPPVVKFKWPESSWKKYFYGYLVEFNKYIVFPQLSYTTNFNDFGTNMITKSYFGQTQIKIIDSEVVFKPFSEASNVYDAYSEILPEKLKQLCHCLDDYDLEIDLYGKKEHYSKPYILTSKACKSHILSYERTMKPQELNIIFNIEGEEFRLADVNDVIEGRQSIEDFVNEYAYYFRNILDTGTLFDIIKARLKNRIRKYIGRK